jgi:hypothetical protein
MAAAAQAQLGEGLYWDAEKKVLCHANIEGTRMHIGQSGLLDHRVRSSIPVPPVGHAKRLTDHALGGVVYGGRMPLE